MKTRSKSKAFQQRGRGARERQVVWEPIILNPPGPIEPSMLEPMTNVAADGDVPLCVALHWIMSNGGVRAVNLDDTEAWASSVEKLRPLICADKVALIGLRPGHSDAERIPGLAFCVIKILMPFQETMRDILLNALPHVVCYCFEGREAWRDGWNDKLYETGRPEPSWAHLEVLKSDLLVHWPRPPAVVQNEIACSSWLEQEMRASPLLRPRPKAAFWEEARKRCPSLRRRQFDRAWDKSIDLASAYNWTKAGPTPQRSDHRSS
jgi:hypothetical protein